MHNLIPNRSDYKDLLCYRKAEAIYDLTHLFTERYFKKGDRTIDQMVQAARSGKQNIVEGYTAGATSAETELKLFNVAKASSLELLTDYEDYLRVRGLRQWEKDSKELVAASASGESTTTPPTGCRLPPRVAMRPSPTSPSCSSARTTTSYISTCKPCRSASSKREASAKSSPA